ncbi:MAG: amidohydrolase family protein [Ilumatobacteraceae bacterium]
MSVDRYTIISADGHAGGSPDQYRNYLEASLLDQFDAWRARYRNPFKDLVDDGRTRNWDSERRLRELDADGVVAEVIFPNTIPPFFPTGQVIAPAPSKDDYALRLAGLRAHNRWLVDFCAAAPGRRAGLAQILLNDIDDAIADVRWAKERGLAGILLPGVSPDTPWIEPLFSLRYDPLWAVCSELAMPVTHHAGGSGIPNYGRHAASTAVFVLETGFFANRALWHLTMAGVFERFPDLRFVMTEQGSSWVPDVLRRMDSLHAQMRNGRIGELTVASETVLARRPSEYFATNCYVGASFPGPADAAVIRSIGLDRVMWGSDYPHHEATFPYSTEALRLTFSAFEPSEMRQLLATNAADVYGFDLDTLDVLGALHGPTLADVARPLDFIPADATSPAFAGGIPSRSG